MNYSHDQSRRGRRPKISLKRAGLARALPAQRTECGDDGADAFFSGAACLTHPTRVPRLHALSLAGVAACFVLVLY